VRRAVPFRPRGSSGPWASPSAPAGTACTPASAMPPRSALAPAPLHARTGAAASTRARHLPARTNECGARARTDARTATRTRTHARTHVHAHSHADRTHARTHARTPPTPPAPLPTAPVTCSAPAIGLRPFFLRSVKIIARPFAADSWEKKKISRPFRPKIERCPAAHGGPLTLEPPVAAAGQGRAGCEGLPEALEAGPAGARALGRAGARPRPGHSSWREGPFAPKPPCHVSVQKGKSRGVRVFFRQGS